MLEDFRANVLNKLTIRRSNMRYIPLIWQRKEFHETGRHISVHIMLELKEGLNGGVALTVDGKILPILMVDV